MTNIYGEPTTSEIRVAAALEAPILSALRRSGAAMDPWDVLRLLKTECRVSARVSPAQARRACESLARQGSIEKVSPTSRERYRAVQGG